MTPTEDLYVPEWDALVCQARRIRMALWDQIVPALGAIPTPPNIDEIKALFLCLRIDCTGLRQAFSRGGELDGIPVAPAGRSDETDAEIAFDFVSESFEDALDCLCDANDIDEFDISDPTHAALFFDLAIEPPRLYRGTA